MKSKKEKIKEVIIKKLLWPNIIVFAVVVLLVFLIKNIPPGTPGGYGIDTALTFLLYFFIVVVLVAAVLVKDYIAIRVAITNFSGKARKKILIKYTIEAIIIVSLLLYSIIDYIYYNPKISQWLLSGF